MLWILSPVLVQRWPGTIEMANSNEEEKNEEMSA